MKFGLTVPSYTWPSLDQKMARLVTKDMAKRAEALGYDSITVWDHLLSAPGLYGGSWMDPLMVLSCVAARPRRFRLEPTSCGAAAPPGAARQGARDPRPHVRGTVHLRRRPRVERARVHRHGDLDERARPAYRRGARCREAPPHGENVSFQGQFWQFEDVTIVPRPEKYFPVWVAVDRASPTPSHPTSPTW